MLCYKMQGIHGSFFVAGQTFPLERCEKKEERKWKIW